MAAPAQHPAYKGLFDYDALKARSNANYDSQDASLRAAPDYGGFNNTMNLMGNQQNKQSQWAPYFQAMQDQGASKVAQDAGRPTGLATSPNFWSQGDVGNLYETGDHVAQQPLMDSTHLAGRKPVDPRNLALNGLNDAFRQPSHGGGY